MNFPKAWAGSDIGLRSDQEDWHAVIRDGESGALLVVVADGMGGHAAGEIASATAGEAFVSSFLDSGESPMTERLMEAARVANVAVADRVAADSSLVGMGTTLLAAHIHDRSLSWVSIGDSCLYIVSGNSISRLNADHSYGAYLDQRADAGEISADVAAADPDRNALMSCVMGDEIEQVEVTHSPLPLADGDTLVAASDGIETLRPEQIFAVVQRGGDSAERIGNLLLETVKDAGRPSQDNVTVVVVRADSSTGR